MSHRPQEVQDHATHESSAPQHAVVAEPLNRPLPASIVTGAHTRAELAAAGVTAGELRSVLWRRTNHGLWAWASADDTNPGERIRRVAAVLTQDDVIGGWAAAHLLGATTFDGFDSSGNRLPVLVCTPRARHRGPARDVLRLRSPVPRQETAIVAGIPVTGSLRTCADLARLAQPWREGVVDVDRFRAVGPLAMTEVGAWVREHRGWRGIPQARRVLFLSKDRVRSPQETRLRLLWRLEALLPDPLVNAEIVRDDGTFLCEADLLDPATGLVAEFDGEPHASARQRSIDESRRSRMRDAGLTVVVVTATGLSTNRNDTVDRLRSAYDQAFRRARPARRWRPR